jgi:predicted CXXCH cytochrome family protein
MVAGCVGGVGDSGDTGDGDTPGDGDGMATARFVGSQVCSQCHRSQHAAWTTTAHSDAWATLVDIGQDTNERCIACHSVGYGREGGFVDATTTPQLTDVGCENCHGAGGEHIQNPQQYPLTSSLSSDLCGGCHQGFHHPTFEQWQESGHAKALETIAEHPYGRDSCLECHSAESILSQGEDVVLALQFDQTPTAVAENSVTCQVCHGAHGTPNEGQLRAPKSELCLTCHTTGNTLPGGEPHHAQREVLLGVRGRTASGDEAIGPNSPHTTAVAARCAQCHVYQEHPEDPTRENPVNTGHTFSPVIPNSCSECHTETQATQLKQAANAEIEGLLANLNRYLDENDSLYIDPETLTEEQREDYDIAVFNTHLVEVDASGGVHNLDYARSLLETAQSLFQGLSN